MGRSSTFLYIFATCSIKLCIKIRKSHKGKQGDKEKEQRFDVTKIIETKTTHGFDSTLVTIT